MSLNTKKIERRDILIAAASTPMILASLGSAWSYGQIGGVSDEAKRIANIVSATQAHWEAWSTTGSKEAGTALVSALNQVVSVINEIESQLRAE